jgi:hypothetical protein
MRAGALSSGVSGKITALNFDSVDTIARVNGR